MSCSIEELTLYAIIAFLLLENALELYLTKRQVNKNDLKNASVNITSKKIILPTDFCISKE